MSTNWRSNNTSNHLSYYNSFSNNKHSLRSYGTPYRERLTANSEFDDRDTKATRERATAYERIENYNSSPSNSMLTTTFSKFSYSNKDYDYDEEKNTSYRPATANSTSTGFYSPVRKQASPSTSTSQVISPSAYSKLHPKKTLVLDLDETLVHASKISVAKPDFVVKLSDTSRYYVLKRPGLDDFLERMSKLYDLVIYTSSEKEYATRIIDKIDPQHLIRTVLHRDHCTLTSYGLDKDLLLLGKDLAGVIFIDNLEENFRLQKDNGLKILDFYSSRKDDELKKLIPFLEYMVDIPDVRPIKRWHSEFLAKGFNNRFETQSPRKKTEPVMETRQSPKHTDRNGTKTSEVRYPSNDSYLRNRYNENSFEVETPSYLRLDASKTMSPSVVNGGGYSYAGIYSKKADRENKPSPYGPRYDKGIDFTDIENYSSRKKAIEEKLKGTWTTITNSSIPNEKSYDIWKYKAPYENEPSRSLSTNERTIVASNDKAKADRYEERINEILRERTKELRQSANLDSSPYGGNAKRLNYSTVLNSDSKVNTSAIYDSVKRSNALAESRLNQTFYSPQKTWVDSRSRLEDMSKYSPSRVTNRNGSESIYSSKLAGYASNTRETPSKRNTEKSPLLEDLYERIAALEKKFKAKNLKNHNF